MYIHVVKANGERKEAWVGGGKCIAGWVEGWRCHWYVGAAALLAALDQSAQTAYNFLALCLAGGMETTKYTSGKD